MVRYSPNRDLKTPMWPRNATVEQLLAATCHIGHNTSLVHPFMKSFISGSFNSIHIINLDYTLAHLRRASSIVREISFRQGIILIIGSRKGQKPIVVKAAERMEGYILYRRWIPGLITNTMSVLGRGRIKDVDTPFPHFASEEVQKKWNLQGLFPEGEVKKSVWNRATGEWELTLDGVPEFRDWMGELRGDPTSISRALVPQSPTTTALQGPSSTATQVTPFTAQNPATHITGILPKHNARLNQILCDARKRGDLQEWMAWNKFATIVSEFSTKIHATLTRPQKAFSMSSLPPEVRRALRVEPVTAQIPDQGDNWYARRLQQEREEWRARREAEASGAYRKPEEIYALDEFLKRRKIGGNIRGEYAVDRVEKMEQTGLKGYDNVKVFRDGSTLVADTRYDRLERKCETFPDGSYIMDGEVYDREGMRYDARMNALVFSDGSMLKFVRSKGRDRFLAVVIGGREVYDVSSAVAGSAAKREILEKAEDLMSWPPKPIESGVAQVTSSSSATASPAETSTTPTASPAPVNESSETSVPSAESIVPGTETTPLSATVVETHNPLERIPPREPTEVSNVLLGSSDQVRYARLPGTQSSRDDAKLASVHPTNENDFTLVKGSELVSLMDAEEAESIDKVVGIANQLPLKEELTFEAEEIPEREPTAFKDMFSSETSTVRPDLLIVLNPRENRLALREATENQIPTIGIIDTDTDPRCVTYSIPANDDSLRSVEYIMGVLSRAGEEGLMHRMTYTRNRNLLISRAETIMKEAFAELKVVEAMEQAEVEARKGWKPRRKQEPEDSKAKKTDTELTPEEVKAKYCEWYNLDPAKNHWQLMRKLISQHVILAQNEIRRLQQDTSGWSLQQHLDLVKTSLRFPNVPRGMMEELAHTRTTGDRHEWADATEAVSRQHARMAILARRVAHRHAQAARKKAQRAQMKA